MTKRDLINLLEARTDIPDDAEIRVTKAIEINRSMNMPARAISYDEFGPLKYLEII